MCDCGEINCSPVKVCGGVIVKRIYEIIFFILRRLNTYPHT